MRHILHAIRQQLEGQKTLTLSRARQLPLEEVPHEGAERRTFLENMIEALIPKAPRVDLARVEVDTDDETECWHITLVWKVTDGTLLTAMKVEEVDTLRLTFVDDEMRSSFVLARGSHEVTRVFDSHRSQVRHFLHLIGDARHVVFKDLVYAVQRLIIAREEVLDIAGGALRKVGVPITLGTQTPEGVKDEGEGNGL